MKIPDHLETAAHLEHAAHLDSAARSGTAAAAEHPGPGHEPDHSARLEHPPRILVIDDQPVNVHLLVRVLKTVGLDEVRSTTDPREAAALFLEFEPDLVLLDLHMPGLDGFGVMEQLRDLTGEDEFVPIIIITADVTPEVRSRALAGGANDFLTKPFERTEVLLRINNLLQTRALHLRLDERRNQAELELERRDEDSRREAAERAEQARRVRAVMDEGKLQVVYQPIVDVRRNEVVGAEALSRIQAWPHRTPDLWFAEAAGVGLDLELELHAIKAALLRLDELPDHAYISVNLSPDTLMSGALEEVVAHVPGSRLVLELTEHAEVEDYDELHHALSRLRRRGVRVAVDDAGAGFASLRHILRLRPDIIKLDRTLTGDIDHDPIRRALSSSLVAFTEEVGGTIVAEGVENDGELQALRRLGIPYAQGYHLGRPGPLPLVAPPDLLDLTDAPARRRR